MQTLAHYCIISYNRYVREINKKEKKMEEFTDILAEWYGKGGMYGHYKMTKRKATKYTRMYMDLFPNLWSDGDSLDREKVLELYMMGEGDALAKKHKAKEAA